MKNSHDITLTGADERTSIETLAQIDAEIGLLYTATPEDRNRYPRRDWIAATAARLSRVAIHVCGSAARRELRAGQLGDLLAHAQRIQVNGVLTISEVEDLCAQYYPHEIITQHRMANVALLDVRARNHAILVDASGGAGRLPDEWRRPSTEKIVGFAGGLGPHNLAIELPKIRAVASSFWWIDMEGRLRVDDWFSVERAIEAVRIFRL